MTSLFERPFLITKMNLTSVSYKAFLIKGNVCILLCVLVNRLFDERMRHFLCETFWNLTASLW